MPAHPESFIPVSLEAHHQIIGQIDPGSITCQPVAQGQMNNLWRADFTQNGQPTALAIRTPLPGRDTAESTYTREAHIRTQLLPPGFAHAPRFHYLELDPLHAVEAYIDGRHPPHKGNEWPDESVIAFAHTIGALHAATERPATEGAAASPKAALLRQYHRITRPTISLSQETAAGPYLQNLHREGEQRVAQLASQLVLSGRHVLNHNDTISRNVLVSQTGITLIDWEYAGLTDPMEGVALGTYNSDHSTPLSGGSMNIRFTGDTEKLFLQAYQKRVGNTSPDFMRHLRTWQATKYTAMLVKLAGILYNPGAPHRWVPSGSSSFQEVETALRTHGYPIFTP